VTGAGGFVGQALCRRLLADGWRVRGAVRTSQGTIMTDGVEIIHIGGIERAVDWPALLSGMEVIVHLAARVHVARETALDPSAAFREINVRATERLAKAATVAGVKRLIYISTVKVHGEVSQKPLTEEDPIAPSDPYSVSKWEAEQVLRRISGETGLDVVIMRPPLVYGPGVKAKFLSLLQWVAGVFPLPFGAIENRRSLIYLENLVDAISVVMIRPEAAGQTFLVSDGQDVSTPQLIRQIATSMHIQPRLWPVSTKLLKFLGSISGHNAETAKIIGSFSVDTSKIGERLQWRPPYAFEEGIHETVKWYMTS
jgi:nucleoside-diphosphate-sugar epimerase